MAKSINALLEDLFEWLVESNAYSTTASIFTRWGISSFMSEYWIKIPVLKDLIVLGKVHSWAIDWVIGLLVVSVLLAARGIALRKKLEPKIKCTFSKDIPGCVDWNITLGSFKCDSYKIKVHAQSFIESFGGYISSITGEKNGIVFSGKTLDLVPERNGEVLVKDIGNGADSHLDLLLLKENNRVTFATKGYRPVNGFRSVDEISDKPDKYHINLTIHSKNSTPVSMELLLDWTGNRATSSVQYIAP